MVKILALCMLFFIKSFALSSLDLARNMLANPALEADLKLLFEGKDYKNHLGYPRWDLISSVLKTNSLINFTLKNPTSLKLRFSSKAEAILFVKIINDALNESGFVHFIPTKFLKQENMNVYELKVESRYLLDPGLFSKILSKNLVYITNVKKISAYSYEYELDFSNANFNPQILIPLNTIKELKRPHKDYLISLQNAKSIAVQANPSDNWFPKLLFLDENLNLLESIKSTEKNNVLVRSLPSKAAYLIIGDNFNLDNIRRGLKIELRR